jgi:hypothetical protein
MSSTCLNQTSSLPFSQQLGWKFLEKIHEAVSGTHQSWLLFISAFACFCFLCSLFLLLFLFLFRSFVFVGFVDFSFLPFYFSNSLGSHQSNFSYPLWWHLPFIIISRLLLSQCSHPKCPSLIPNWRCLFHAQISASNSDPANVTAQEGGNTSPAMNEVLTGTTTKDRFVLQQAPASMRVNSESVSNEIDESDLQNKKHFEQRI